MTKSKLQKSKPLSKTAQEELKKYDLDIQVGNYVIEENGNIFRISAILAKGIDLEDYDDEDDEWCRYGTIDYDDFKRKYTKLDKPIEDYEKELFEAMKNPDALIMKDIVPSDSTDIVLQSDKQNVLQLKSRLDGMERQVSILASILNRKREEMLSILHDYRDKIEKVTKVIHTIELYLGINEDIIQIAEGIPAPAEEPITIRQLVLFMDEEYGDAEEGGLDFHRIEEFDQWIVSNAKYYNQVLPESKGIVCLRVRRNDKYYSENVFVNAFMNANNHKSYLLIRNGQNFYRIWANVAMGERLIPRRKELDLKKPDESFARSDNEEIEEKAFTYKQKALLLQGLIDRTDIFKPHPLGINIFKPETYQNMVRLILDDEQTLPSGRVSFREWQKSINNKIERGTRILWIAKIFGENHGWDTGTDRFDIYYREYHVPKRPPTSIYSVEEVGRKRPNEKIDMRQCKIIYNPKDIVYDNSWRAWDERIEDHTRKRGVGIWFYKEEDFILNYDLVDLNDVEFYLQSRVDRPNYLDMIPVLKEIKKKRLEEIAYEKQFVEALGKRMAQEHQEDEKEIIALIWKHVSWWKTKVIWKRPILEDDSKAWRMIRQKVENQIRPKA